MPFLEVLPLFREVILSLYALIPPYVITALFSERDYAMAPPCLSFPSRETTGTREQLSKTSHPIFVSFGLSEPYCPLFLRVGIALSHDCTPISHPSVPADLAHPQSYEVEFVAFA